MANNRDFPSTLDKRLNATGLKIGEYRKAQHLTKQSLSNKLMMLGIDISAKSIYHIERGTRTVADFELCAIAKVLNIHVEQLLEDYFNSLDLE